MIINLSDLKNSGIYKIKNIINDKSYVGSAINICRRWVEHSRQLGLNCHPNIHLQAAWNKYGENNFKWEVLEYCPCDKLIEREQYYINLLQVFKNGYNRSPTAGSPLGFKHTIEVKAKMSASAKIKIFTYEHRSNMALAQIGRKHSEEVKAKISAAHMGQLRSEQHKINNGKAHQHFDKWPHPRGRRCKCIECKKKKAAYNLAAYYRKKANG